MLKKIIVLVGLLLSFGVAHAETLELTAPVKKWNNVEVWTLKFTTDGQNSCYWKKTFKHWPGHLCHSWGITYAQIEGQKEEIEDIKFLGLDYYVTFKGGPYYQRVGFGAGLFNKRTETVRQGWDFHISWQVGGMYTKNLGWFIGLDHWSNGASFAEQLNLEQYWPKDENGEPINDGGDTLGIGLRWEF